MAKKIDVLAMAAQDLLDNSVPDPDMLLSNLTIFSAVYFLQQTADFVVRHMTGLLLAEEADDLEDGDGPIQALAAVTTANGNLNQACIYLGLFDESE